MPKLRGLWLHTRLYAWLEELLLIEFDSNGYFYVHRKNDVLPPRIFESDFAHHGVSAGTTFVMTRKALMSQRKILLAFNSCELEQEVWLKDVIWYRFVPACDLGVTNNSEGIDLTYHGFCPLQRCFANWFRKFPPSTKINIT